MFSLPSPPKGCPVTLTLIALNVLIYIGQQATQGALTELGLLYGPFVGHGQFWRIVTSAFLHGSIIHIGFNAYLLYVLGPQLEQGFGSLRFALMYFGSLFGGSLAVLLFGFTQPTLGASGAVLGLAGAMFAALLGRGVSPTKSPVFGLVALNLALPLMLPGISFWGHFGGVVAGAVMAFVLITLPDKTRSVSSGTSISYGAAAVVLLAVACFIAPQLALGQ